MIKKTLILLSVFFQALIFIGQVPAQENDPRLLIHILDYLSKDYGGAVSEGKVINPAEYQEQIDFAASALSISNHLELMRSNSGFLERVAKLKKLITDKQPPSEVSALARELQSEVIQASKIEIAPPQWPNIEKGKILYQTNCAACHGEQGRGDGPAAKGLDPSPANFKNSDRFFDISPFQAFNSIRLGVSGTAMLPFKTLSDQEVWNLAFYVISLRYQEMNSSSLSAAVSIPLKEISSLSDKGLKEKYFAKETNASSLLASLRLQRPQNTNSLSVATRNLSEAKAAYLKGNIKDAKNFALISYLEGVEPIETRLRASDPALVSQIEQTMADLRVLIEQNAPVHEVEEKVTQVEHLLEKADELINSANQHSKWFVFFMAFSIILREGFEAVLVLVTILGVAKMLNSKKAVYWTHAGWITALFCGVLAWIFSGWLLGMSGANREAMEGYTSLFAMVVLLYVGFWLHSKSEIGKWTAYIKKQMDGALQGGKLLGIALISFVSVFREVFETVLFLRALWLEGAASEKTALMLGIAASFVLIFLLANLLLKWSVKLPIRKLFAFSSIVMVILAIVLTGKGIRALQIAGKIQITPLNIPLDLSLLGIYPSLETLLSQAILLAFIALLWSYEKKQRLASS